MSRVWSSRGAKAKDERVSLRAKRHFKAGRTMTSRKALLTQAEIKLHFVNVPLKKKKKKEKTPENN